MNKKNLSVLLYGGIAVCITIMLILFSGTLSTDEDKIEDAPVTDELFVPESVVKLTDENTKLRTTMEQYADDILTLNEQLKEKDNTIAENNKIIETFNKLSYAAYLILQNDTEGAEQALAELDVNTMDENARILYEMISKEIE